MVLSEISLVVALVGVLVSSGCTREAEMRVKEAVMREAAVEFVAEQLSCSADDLTATLIPNDFFKEWAFWRVSNHDLPPRTVFVATGASGARRITIDGGFAVQTHAEPAKIANEQRAMEYVRFFLRVAAPYTNLLDSARDIPGASEDEIETWQVKIQPPTVRTDGDGYILEEWIWNGGELSQARFVIDGRGGIHASLRTQAVDVGFEPGLE